MEKIRNSEAVLIAVAAVLTVAIIILTVFSSTWRNTAVTSKIVAATTTATKDRLININTATKKQLMKLPGVGEKTAKRIIDYRDFYGDFEFKDDIMFVEGIGSATYEQFADLITVE